MPAPKCMIKLCIEGWRKINHSYAMVNQRQIIELSKLPISIKHKDIPFYNKNGFGHTGGIDGFSSVFLAFTDDDIYYALNSNGTNFNNNDISIAVLSEVFDKPYKIPVFSNFEVGLREVTNFVQIVYMLRWRFFAIFLFSLNPLFRLA